MRNRAWSNSGAETDMDSREESNRPRFSRRTLARGAAWTAPAVLVAAAAPAYAVSSECTPLTTSQLPSAAPQFSSSALAGWTAAVTAGSFKTSPVIGYRQSYGPNGSSLSNQAVLEADPRVTTVASATLSTTPFCLAPGTYTFAYSGRSYAINARGISLDAAVIEADAPNSALASAATWTVPANSSHGSLSRNFTLTLTERKSVRFRYTWTLPASNSTVGNDIGVQAPTVTKTS